MNQKRPHLTDWTQQEFEGTLHPATVRVLTNTQATATRKHHPVITQGHIILELREDKGAVGIKLRKLLDEAFCTRLLELITDEVGTTRSTAVPLIGDDTVLALQQAFASAQYAHRNALMVIDLEHGMWLTGGWMLQQVTAEHGITLGSMVDQSQGRSLALAR